MWTIEKPEPVKLICGILACGEDALAAAVEALSAEFGKIDLKSSVWPFTQTDYYAEQTGENILRQLVTFDKLIAPGLLATIKHKTNRLEQELADKLKTEFPRPVNLDPGIIEPSKLVLASTKNFAHRVYIGDNMYAEITLRFSRGKWVGYEHTFPDYKEQRYHDFLSKARERAVEQLRGLKQNNQESGD